MKFNDKNCKRNWEKIEHKMNKKRNRKTIHFSIITPYWFLFFIEQFNIDWDSPPKNPFNYLSIYVILKQSIAKRDLDDSISCSYYKKEWWCWKFLWQQNICQHFFISLIKIKPSISICSCTSDDSILFKLHMKSINVEIYFILIWALRQQHK